MVAAGLSLAPVVGLFLSRSPLLLSGQRHGASLMTAEAVPGVEPAQAPPAAAAAALNVVVEADGVRSLGEEGEAVLRTLLEKSSDKSMGDVWRRSAFWENETASLLEIVNVLGRWERCSEWKDRTIFIDETDLRAKDEDERQALTTGRHQMALRLGCGERSAMFQNVPNLPFTNAKIAASVGLTVDDFQALPVTRAACNVLFDGLAESRSGLIPYKVLDERRARMVGEGGAFDQAGFRVGWAKSCILFIFGLFFFGKANFIWVLLAVKFAHDWQPDLIPGPKEMGLFKVWGIV